MTRDLQGDRTAASPFTVLLDYNLGMCCCGRSSPYIHPLTESAWHLIHLERDLERDPDLELEELREWDLEDKKETEPFQYFPKMNHSSMTLWYSMDPNYSNVKKTRKKP